MQHVHGYASSSNLQALMAACTAHQSLQCCMSYVHLAHPGTARACIIACDGFWAWHLSSMDSMYLNPLMHCERVCMPVSYACEQHNQLCGVHAAQRQALPPSA